MADRDWLIKRATAGKMGLQGRCELELEARSWTLRLHGTQR